MLRILVNSVLTIALIVVAPCSVNCWAQQSKKPDVAGQTAAQGPRRHLANIIFAGLAGAVLGLSTLSFYGRPQDRLSNIAVGFAIGVICGTVYTTYKAAAEPRDFYSNAGWDSRAELWAVDEASRRDAVPLSGHDGRTGFRFEF